MWHWLIVHKINIWQDLEFISFCSFGMRHRERHISCEPDAQSLMVLENDHEVMKNIPCTSRGGSLGRWENLPEEGKVERSLEWVYRGRTFSGDHIKRYNF